MTNETTIAYLRNDIYDHVFTWLSLGLGVPGNIMIFLAFRSFPNNASKLLYQLLALFDLISLVLLISQRPLVWYDVLTVEQRAAAVLLKVYLNVVYYVGIFTNLVSVFLVLERLLYHRYPNSHAQYYNSLDRVKLTLIILGLLIMSFCLIITIKMSYYGFAWVVVFLTFYSIWPSVSIIACIVLIITHYYKKYKERQFFDQNKPLAASHSSFVDKSSSVHSALSASGPLKGSYSSSHGFKGKKKDPYSLYQFVKCASESHLAVNSDNNAKPEGSKMTKAKSGNCVNTVVSLKVPSLYNLAVHRAISKDDFLTQDQEEQLQRKKTTNQQLTRMAIIGTVFVVLGIVPLAACAILLLQRDKEGLDLSDDYTYLMVTVTSLVMYTIHGNKFYTYCLVSSIFRRHVRAVFTCSQNKLRDEVSPQSAH